jgi:hypothetical protein
MSCSTTTGSCETKGGDTGASSSTSCATEKCHACGGHCGGDPATCATNMWACAFFTAMKQAHVDILKAKIQKAWGPKLEKSADAVLASMEVKWMSMLSEAQAKEDLKAKLKKIMSEK